MSIPFPSVYSNELLYSIFARYHCRGGHIDSLDSMEELIGHRVPSCNIGLPTRIAAISNQLPPSLPFSDDGEYFIRKHTLFQLYEPFISPEKAKQLMNSMKSSTSGNSHYTATGINSSMVPASKFLKYCPACINDDIQEYGEAYWHRNHQVIGVVLCYKHETVWLLNSNVYSKKGIYKLETLDNIIHNQYFPKGTNIIYHGKQEHYLYLTRSITWLLDNKIKTPNLEMFSRHYIQKLQKFGYRSHIQGQIINKEKLLNDFTRFYGNNFLAEFNLQLDASKTNNWLFGLLQQTSSIHQPIQHLLLMNFLNITPEEFFTSLKGNDNPFGTGPWPCLNYTSDHYEKKNIRKAQFLRNINRNKLTGYFTCPDCGFKYKKTISEGNKNIPEVGKILSYGHIWKNKVSNMFASNYTITKIADSLMTFPSIIAHQLTEKSNKKR